MRAGVATGTCLSPRSSPPDKADPESFDLHDSSIHERRPLRKAVAESLRPVDVAVGDIRDAPFQRPAGFLVLVPDPISNLPANLGLATRHLLSPQSSGRLVIAYGAPTGHLLHAFHAQ